jgi:hypothetical protein
MKGRLSWDRPLLSLASPPMRPARDRCHGPLDRRQRMGESGGAAADLFSKRTALLPPYTTGIVRIRKLEPLPGPRGATHKE